MSTPTPPSSAPARGQAVVKFLNRGLFQRALGRCATHAPRDANCWQLANHQLLIDLKRGPELSRPGGYREIARAAQPALPQDKTGAPVLLAQRAI